MKTHISGEVQPPAVLRFLLGLVRTVSPTDPFGVTHKLLDRVGKVLPASELHGYERWLAVGERPPDTQQLAPKVPTDEAELVKWRNNARFTEVLLSLLAERDPIAALVNAAQPRVDADDLREIIADVVVAADPRVAAAVSTAWSRTPPDERQTFLRLITDVVADVDDPIREILATTPPTEEGRAHSRQRLLDKIGRGEALDDATHAAGLVQLAPSGEEQETTRAALIGRIGAVAGEAMGPVASAFSLLGPTDEQWAAVGEVLVRRMQDEELNVAATIAGGLASAPATARAAARLVLLDRLKKAPPELAAAVTATLLALEPTGEDLVQLVGVVPAEALSVIGSAVRAKVDTDGWFEVLRRLG